MPKIHTTQEHYSQIPFSINCIFVTYIKKQKDIIALTEISKQAEIIIKNDIKNASKDVIKVSPIVGIVENIFLVLHSCTGITVFHSRIKNDKRFFFIQRLCVGE